MIIDTKTGQRIHMEQKKSIYKYIYIMYNKIKQRDLIAQRRVNSSNPFFLFMYSQYKQKGL